MGTIEVGKLADIVIAKTNPIQDIRSLENNNNIALVMKDGKPFLVTGSPGGDDQCMRTIQTFVNIVDFGMNIQEALEAPRFTKTTFEGCDVRIESRMAASTFDDLRRRGHMLMVGDPYNSQMGCGQAVLRNFSTRVNFGASDPRKDGAAIPEPRRR